MSYQIIKTHTGYAAVDEAGFTLAHGTRPADTSALADEVIHEQVWADPPQISLMPHTQPLFDRIQYNKENHL